MRLINKPMIIIDLPTPADPDGYYNETLRLIEWLSDDVGIHNIGKYRNAHGDPCLAVIIPPEMEEDVLSKESKRGIWIECLIFTELYESDFYYIDTEREVYMMVNDYSNVPTLLHKGHVQFQNDQDKGFTWCDKSGRCWEVS